MFLKIPIYVERANLSGNWHVAGFPAMTAIDGFLHKLQLDIQSIDPGFYITKWSVIVESSDLEKGIKKFSGANQSIKHDGCFNPPIVDERIGNLNMTMVAEITSNFQTAEWNVMRSDERVKAIFSALRFAGGSTTIFTKPYSEKHAGRVIEFYDVYIDALKRINRRAFLIEDKTNQLTTFSREGESKIDTMIRLLRTQKSNLSIEQQQMLDQDLPEGKFVPLAVGYRLLEEPRVKEGGRDTETPHAYAEPIIGLGRVRNLGSVLRHLSIADSDQSILPFWRNDRIQDDASKTILLKNYYAVCGC